MTSVFSGGVYNVSVSVFSGVFINRVPVFSGGYYKQPGVCILRTSYYSQGVYILKWLLLGGVSLFWKLLSTILSRLFNPNNDSS